MQRMLQCGHGSKTVEMRHSPTACAMPTMLQCGHGSKTVEIPPRFEAPPVSSGRLQCGHGSKTVEIRKWPMPPFTASDASMRPRLQDRGDYKMRVNASSGLDASMRPRLQDRGDEARSILAWLNRHPASMRPRLQDRGDVTRPIEGRCPGGELQCGHGSKTVEMKRRWSREAPAKSSFNAATAPRPWRFQHMVFSAKFSGKASMRPRLQDRGDLQAEDPDHRLVVASMRPRLQDRGDAT